MAPVADASAASLYAFVTDHVASGVVVITDGWQGYRGLDKRGYTHEPRSQRAARARGEDPGDLLPAVHRVASPAKRWLLGTHQGAINDAHLPDYLDVRVPLQPPPLSQSRPALLRVLQLAVDHDPVRYRDLIAQPQPERRPASPQVPATIRRPETPTRRETLANLRLARLRIDG
jgi:ISXO2-like transposase domain